MKWKHFPRYWPFVRRIHRSPVNSPHKGQWRGALMFSLICVWINDWVNNGEAGDLRRYRIHYDVTVMKIGAVKIIKFENRMRSGGTYVRPDIYPPYIRYIEFNASNDLRNKSKKVICQLGRFIGHYTYELFYNFGNFCQTWNTETIIHQISMHVFFILAKLFHHSYDCACDIEADMACIEIFVHSVTAKMSHVCICLESISYK